MTNEERNHTMDTSGIMGPAGEHIVDSSNVLQAIRECDRKARAWDALESQIKRARDLCREETEWDRNLGIVQTWMVTHLAPPKPKSKLERLRDFVDQKARPYPSFPKMIRWSDVVDEIDRLEAEDAEKD